MLCNGLSAETSSYTSLPFDFVMTPPQHIPLVRPASMRVPSAEGGDEYTRKEMLEEACMPLPSITPSEIEYIANLALPFYHCLYLWN